MKPEIKTGILISNIYHCKDLIPSDNEGTSDPFITISYHGIENSTNVIDQTLNPVWNERLNLKIPIIIKESGPDYEEARILIKIFDKDSIKLLDTQVYSKDEFLGAGVIEVLEAKKAGFLVFNNKTIPNPQWVNLKCKYYKLRLYLY